MTTQYKNDDKGLDQYFWLKNTGLSRAHFGIYDQFSDIRSFMLQDAPPLATTN